MVKRCSPQLQVCPLCPLLSGQQQDTMLKNYLRIAHIDQRIMITTVAQMKNRAMMSSSSPTEGPFE